MAEQDITESPAQSHQQQHPHQLPPHPNVPHIPQSGQVLTSNLYMTYLQTKLSTLEILQSNLHLRLEVQSLMEQFLGTLELYNSQTESNQHPCCTSSSNSAQSVSAARARVRTLYAMRRACMKARRMKLCGPARKLPFTPASTSTEAAVPLKKLHPNDVHEATSIWKTPDSSPCKKATHCSDRKCGLGTVTPPVVHHQPNRQFPKLDISEITSTSVMMSSQHDSPFGPLHSTMRESPDHVQRTSRVSGAGKSRSSVNLSGLSQLITSTGKCYSDMDITGYSGEVSALPDIHSFYSYQNGPQPCSSSDLLLQQQNQMMESMRKKIKDLEMQLRQQHGLCTACSRCSLASHTDLQTELNVSKTGDLFLQGAGERSATSQLSCDPGELSFGSFIWPKRRKMSRRKNASDSELYSPGKSNTLVSHLQNQLDALDLSGHPHYGVAGGESPAQYKLPSMLMNFDETDDGFAVNHLSSRTPALCNSPVTSNCSSPAKSSSVVSTPLYPSTGRTSSDDHSSLLEPTLMDSDLQQSEHHSDQDTTLIKPDQCPDKENQCPNLSDENSVLSTRLRRQTGQTNLDPDEIRDPLCLTMSDLLSNNTTGNLTEVSGLGGYNSLGATCASSPDMNGVSATSDSSLDSCDIMESIFPKAGRRLRSDSSFKESDGLSESSLNLTVQEKRVNTVTPAESLNNLTVPVNSPNATNTSSSSSRPTTDSNDRVEVAEVDYRKVRYHMQYRMIRKQYSKRPSPIGKQHSLEDDTNNNRVRQFKLPPRPPLHPNASRNQSVSQNIPPAQPLLVKAVTDGDSGFSTQNSQYANEQARAANQRAASHKAASTQVTRTLSKTRKKQLVCRMKQFSSTVNTSSRKRSSTAGLQTLGFL